MSRNRTLFRLYAALALVGAVFPWIIFLPWLGEHGVALRLFGTELFATRPAAIFATDVLYSAGVFILFVFVEGRRLAMRHLWLPVLLVFACGLCAALPTFLAMRERAPASR
ncbi:MAG TPA: DUF2834 domain-containing protein [Allosphingosinicella sp.]